VFVSLILNEAPLLALDVTPLIVRDVEPTFDRVTKVQALPPIGTVKATGDGLALIAPVEPFVTVTFPVMVA
jgi:hypothetical protein